MKTLEEKYNSFVDNMTYYIPDSKYDKIVKREVNLLARRIKSIGYQLKADDVHKMMEEDPVATFEFIRAATGVSKESIKNLFVATQQLPSDIREALKFSEWENEYRPSNASINRGLINDKALRIGIVNLFVHGHNLSRFTDVEDQRKYDIRNIRELSKSPISVIRRIVQQQLSGKYRVSKSMREEEVPRKVLDALGVNYISGSACKISRNMDCIIGTVDNPEAMIECSFYSTTNGVQSDKKVAYIKAVQEAKKKFNGVKTYLFIDGPGWLRRQKDLKDMLNVADDVFTYKRSEIKRFSQIVEQEYEVEAAV